MRRENITIFEIETDELSFTENDDVIFSVFYGVFGLWTIKSYNIRKYLNKVNNIM